MTEALKNAADALREAVGSFRNRSTAAIVVAAGNGTRMGGQTPKQFLNLCGMPVVVHALKAFEESVYITETVVVCRAGDEPLYEEFREEFGLRKISAIVPGGKTRQESVLCGVEAVSKKTAFVAIADGARPLVTPEMISRVCLEAYRYGAATAAVPATDTVKIAEKGFIGETVDRSKVWLAQTPQVFGLAAYRAAAYSSLEEGFESTDDNSLCEHIGIKVRAVDCGKENIKITEQVDMAIAEAVIGFRKRNVK